MERHVTEEEAKTKWCPFARKWCPFAQPGSVDRGATCLASACMAWREAGQQKFRDATTGRLTDLDTAGNGTWITVGGFCGLAGVPQ
jgi:hypothetical protein